MRDETPTSTPGLPQYPTRGKRDGGQRQRTKVWEALVVATGLAISSALYPLPAVAPLLKLSPPKYETSDFPALVRSAATDRRIAAAAESESDLADLVEVIDNDVLVLRTDTLLELVKTRGLPDPAGSIELLRAFQSLTQGHPLALSGGGGGDVPVDVTSTTLPELLTLLELLLEALPTSSGPQMTALLNELLPLLGQSLGPAGPPAVTPLDTKVFTQDETALPIPLPRPVLTPTVSPDPRTAVPAKPTVAPPPDPVPAPSAVPSPSAVPAPTSPQAPVTAPVPQVETPTTSAAPQPDPTGAPTASPSSEPTNTPGSTAPDSDAGPTGVTDPDEDRETTTGTPSKPDEHKADDADKGPGADPPKSPDNSPSEPKDKPDNGNSTPGS